MKKFILSFLLLTGGYVTIAQTKENKEINNNRVNWGIVNAALPKIETYVSQDVINKLKNKYGSTLYDITTIIGTSIQIEYAIRLSDDGVYRTDYVDENGNHIER
jgi:hypothetical protein